MTDKPTIKSTVAILRITAQMCGDKKTSSSSGAASFYNETADVLEAIGKAYEDLYNAALTAVEEGDLKHLRAHIGKIESLAKEVEGQKFGAI